MRCIALQIAINYKNKKNPVKRAQFHMLSHLGEAELYKYYNNTKHIAFSM